MKHVQTVQFPLCGHEDYFERDPLEFSLIFFDSEVHMILYSGWTVVLLHMRCLFSRFLPSEIVDVVFIDLNHLCTFQLVSEPNVCCLAIWVYYQGQDLYANKAVRDKQIVRILGKVRFT